MSRFNAIESRKETAFHRCLFSINEQIGELTIIFVAFSRCTGSDFHQDSLFRTSTEEYCKVNDQNLAALPLPVITLKKAHQLKTTYGLASVDSIEYISV